ncbi:VOC family protein [Pseudonocardia nematodicida]|uniref:VOC family protein n=1 Tax=Pseudonocardia nematodicida TaxID=1206997 RepID=A0ABV1K7B7_9PSEU
MTTADGGRRNRAVPPPTVVPVLVYPDVPAAVAWLTATFGFVERTRIGDDHRAQLGVGDDGAVIVADVRHEQVPPVPGAVTHVIRVRVEDVDALHERARSRGARVLEEPVDREYGERECSVEDLAGHRWQFSETVSDVAPEDFGCTPVSPWP